MNTPRRTITFVMAVVASIAVLATAAFGATLSTWTREPQPRDDLRDEGWRPDLDAAVGRRHRVQFLTADTGWAGGYEGIWKRSA